MPLDNFITRPDYSRQLKQYTNTNAIFSGATNILQKFSVKDIEIDTAGANDGDALIFNSATNKFSPNTPGTLGSRVIGGLILTYNSGLTYNVSEGTFRISSTLYGYTGGTIDIMSGLTSGSRFDVVFITSASTALVSAGTTAINPSVPQINISGGELQVGIIFIPASFTGGTGTNIIQSTGSTFEFNNNAASAGIQRQGGVGSVASGDYSFSSNFEAKASGNYSSAIGYYAEATGLSQTVVGQYNTPDEGFFIVGNGTAPGSRSNAFRVTTGGSVFISDNLKVTNNISGSALYLKDTTSSSYGLIQLADNYLQFFDTVDNKLIEIDKSQGLSILDSTTTYRTTIYSSGNSASRSYMLPNKDGTIALISDLTSASGTSLGDGVKVLFSSDTTSLSFATLSSQTPSALRIISSSTGVILFSATTGSGGPGGGVGTLQQVTDSGNTTTNGIQVADLSANTLYVYDSANSSYGKIYLNEDAFYFFQTVSNQQRFAVDKNYGLAINDLNTNANTANLAPTALTDVRTYNFPDKNGTFLLEGYEYMDLATAQGGGPFKIGQWYRIPVSSRTTVTEANNPTTYGDIVLFAVDTDKLSNDGYLLAINADYQNVGNYSDANTLAVGTTSRKGVPPWGTNYVAKDILIYNNTHWLCTTNFLGIKSLAELQNNTYFTQLTKDYATRYGYIIEVDKITYDITNDRILSRQDKRGNVVYDRDSAILEYFRFGDDNVKDNLILKPIGKLNILNRPTNYLKFNNNKLLSFNQIYANPTTFIVTGNPVNISLSGCVINEYNFNISESTGIVANNTSFDNLRTNTEPLTLTITSTTIDLTNRWHYNEIRLKSGTTYNGVPISAITSNAPYNNTITFRPDPYTTPTPTIVFRNNTNLKTEGGLDVTISNQYDSVEFTFLSAGFVIQKNIYNYV